MTTIEVYIPQSMTVDIELFVLVSQAVQRRYDVACAVHQKGGLERVTVRGASLETCDAVERIVIDLLRLQGVGVP